MPMLCRSTPYGPRTAHAAFVRASRCALGAANTNTATNTRRLAASSKSSAVVQLFGDLDHIYAISRSGKGPRITSFWRLDVGRYIQ